MKQYRCNTTKMIVEAENILCVQTDVSGGASLIFYNSPTVIISAEDVAVIRPMAGMMYVQEALKCRLILAADLFKECYSPL